MSLGTSMFLLFLIATVTMLFVSYLSYRKRQLPTARYSFLVMLAASFYALGYAFELLSTDVEHIIFWLKVEYIGIPFISTLWLMMVIHYTGYQTILNKWLVLLIFVIPTLTLIMHYTNDMHHFFYRDIIYDDSHMDVSKIILLKAPWYWVHIVYNYVQAAAGMTLFTVMYLKALPIVRKQIIVMMLGTAAPWFMHFIYLFGTPEFNIDLTPLGFVITGFIYIWGIYRINLLRLTPIAMQTAFETMHDGLIILDYNYNITDANRAAKQIFGELEHFQEGMDSGYHIFNKYPELMSKLSEPEFKEGRILLKRGMENRWYILRMSIINDKDGIELGKMLVFNDITQITVYQEELMTNVNRLEEFNTFRNNLFTVLTHDIREPLAVLVNLTEMLEEELEENGTEPSVIVQEVSEHVRGTFLLAENLLDWFRSQQGAVKTHPLMWELASIVEEAIEQITIRCEHKNITISDQIEEGLIVCADKNMLDVVIRNLLSNAVKFTQVGGHIHIGAIQEGAFVCVFIRDSGVGIDRDMTNHLFEEILENTTTGTEGEKGRGLGLYLCKQFVQLIGGTIWLDSVPDEETTFYFTIPVKPIDSLHYTSTIGQETRM